MSLFSIIVPVYNTKQYIGRCINSILNQTYNDFEVILVDDGSTDGSAKICDDYAKQDFRIKVIHQCNSGVSMARNTGIANATGKYIWFVDSDDYIEANALLFLNEVINAYKADLYVFNKKRIDMFCGELEEFFEQHYFTYHLGFESWNKLYRTDIIKNNKLIFDEEETIGEDLLFNICYYMHLKKGAYFLDSHLYNYDERMGSAMNSKSKYRLLQQLRLFEKEKRILHEQVSIDILQKLFLLHFISGVYQSKMGGLTRREFVKIVDFDKYRQWFRPEPEVVAQFFKSEKASRLGQWRIRLLLKAMQVGWYKVAGCILALD